MKPNASPLSANWRKALALTLQDALDLLSSDPKEAGRQAKSILRSAPRHPGATLILASARRRQHEPAEALALIKPLVRSEPRNPLAQYELGEILAALGRSDDAIAAFRRAVALRPDLGHAWRALADLLFLSGDREAADEAYGRYVAGPLTETELVDAAAASARGDAAAAESLLRRHLADRPRDVRAMTMLADVIMRLDAFGEAAVLLNSVLERHPSHVAARHGRALAQLRLGQPAADVVADLKQVLAVEPDNDNARSLLGNAMAAMGDAAGAAEAFERMLAGRPDDLNALVWYGDSLKYAGRPDEAIDAFRRAIAIDARHGEAWFRLGDTKTYRFTAEEEASMRSLLAGDGVKPDQRVFLHYALARARADAGDWAQSFSDYAAGAALRRSLKPFDPDLMTTFVGRCKALFDRTFFAARAGGGRPDADPIFIVGLPRSGSTLVEQILASHSLVEGTAELPYVGLIADRLTASIRSETYPGVLAGLTPTNCSDLGEAYLDAARAHRRLGRPRFIDKMPENFQHVGMIQLTLPNARIIDVRRSPMASGFAIFRQHFGDSRAYAYDLGDIGRFYRDYVDLMALWDRALPGRVHRVVYEDLVTDTDAEIRRLLDHCGLPFEPACLTFHETKRAVMTPSAEQVRQPITARGVDEWRAYEPWLGPLREALGPALETWRGDAR